MGARCLLTRLLGGIAASALAFPVHADICPTGIAEFPVASVELELLTSPDVLYHLPGPSEQNHGDRRIGTADDGIAQNASIFGAPNDLGREGTGLPGSPGTRALHGTSFRDSFESSAHAADSDGLDLSRPGEGALSYVKARIGQLESFSYLAGGVVALPKGFQGGRVAADVVQLTVAGTTLVPGVLFRGPFNTDLVSVSPGSDREFDSRDDVAEHVARGCAGLTPGTDGVADWFPLDLSAVPSPLRLGLTNRAEWDPSSAKPREPTGRRISGVADTVTKIPTSGAFFVSSEIPLEGYLFPRDEAEALLTPSFHPDGNLPDLPDFPGSGNGLARYFAQVLAPLAEARGAQLVAMLSGRTSVRVIGVGAQLEFQFVAAGTFGAFDLCSLEITSCE